AAAGAADRRSPHPGSRCCWAGPMGLPRMRRRGRGPGRAVRWGRPPPGPRARPSRARCGRRN
ncbi:MAG: hypothetical protein ACK559_20895, partial [bacterium]